LTGRQLAITVYLSFLEADRPAPLVAVAVSVCLPTRRE
jgi:hypothetical protein